jgi:DNA polymerase-3 subunit alpha
LRLHSEYSLADSIIQVKPLAAAVRERQMPAVALTDRSNLFGLIKFYRACLDQGVKPLIDESGRLSEPAQTGLGGLSEW